MATYTLDIRHDAPESRDVAVFQKPQQPPAGCPRHAWQVPGGSPAVDWSFDYAASTTLEARPGNPGLPGQLLVNPATPLPPVAPAAPGPALGPVVPASPPLPLDLDGYRNGAPTPPPSYGAPTLAPLDLGQGRSGLPRPDSDEG